MSSGRGMSGRSSGIGGRSSAGFSRSSPTFTKHLSGTRSYGLSPSHSKYRSSGVYGYGKIGGYSGHSNHRAYKPSDAYYYRNYGHIPRSSSSIVRLSPYGIGIGYADRNFRIAVGTSGYYRPNYRYYYGGYGYPYTHYSDPFSAYYSYRPSYSLGYAVPYRHEPRTLFPPGGLTLSETIARNNLMRPPAEAPVVSEPVAAGPFVQTSEAAKNSQRNAEAAFHRGEYELAARLSQETLQLDPQNGIAHLYASQTKFAVGDYRGAYQDLDTATQLLPKDQYSFVVKNFRKLYGKNDYVSQTDQLSNHIERNPADSQAYTIRGYHYGGLGYPKAATKDFQQALAMDPDNQLAQRLLDVLGQSNGNNGEKQTTPVPAPPVEELPEPLDLEEVQGNEVLRLVPDSPTELTPVLSGPIK